MNRRDFLRNTLATTALYSAGGLPGISNLAAANGFAPINSRMLVNIMLDGGPDFRHLFAPAFDADTLSFGHRYWEANNTAHSIDGNANAWEQRWNQDYNPVGSAGYEFGILNNSGWLQSMWDAGNVAIVSNVFGSSSRDHAESKLIMDQGNRSSGQANSLRSGWGGRLAAACDTNVVAVTRTPRPFCYGPHPDDPENRSGQWLIPAQDVRDMRLFEASPDDSPRWSRPVITRSLRSYYAVASNELPSDSVYRRFANMERQLREIGEPLDVRMQNVPIPAEIAALYNDVQPALENSYFGEQIRNLHDSIAANDIFDMRIASLEYTGFDTHEGQRDGLETRLNDLFGTGKALDALWQNLPADARANTVFVLAGEFGRQIRSNGDAGTDHGEGTYVLLIGEGVNGGVYGDMYPESELSRLDDPSPQIAGQTAIDHVFGAVCDWMQPGSGSVVFPDRISAPIESGLNLAGLFA
ncbi:MAG: DUF1501 domain-containing protein [Gammaproteobacteria bacterium]|nr:DUF1501 domain-containing protein [Gammaproteobacteria bacterium]